MVKALAKNPAVELCLLASADELEHGAMPFELGLSGIPVVKLPWKRATREALWLATNSPPIDRYVPEECWIYNSMETYVPARKCRRIVTVHHIETSASWLAAFRLKKAIRTADLVVAQSTFTARQIISQFNVPEARIAVVGSGVDESFLARSREAPFELPPSPYAPYAISIGAFQLRKGSDYLFEMARELQRRGSPLKIVCPFGLRGLSPFTEEVKALTNVVALDYISRGELLDLIRGAVCMVIPSRLEGFGLTAIESMALGTPVIASNNSALPETLGGAGILVDPSDVRSLTNALEKVFKDQGHRSSLVTLGCHRARDFTWTHCMERLLAGIAKK